MNLKNINNFHRNTDAKMRARNINSPKKKKKKEKISVSIYYHCFEIVLYHCRKSILKLKYLRLPIKQGLGFDTGD